MNDNSQNTPNLYESNQEQEAGSKEKACSQNMAEPSNSDAKTSLSDTLNQLTAFPEDAALTLGNIVDTLGNKGFGILLIFLALPSAIPVPAAGYSIPFGLVLIALALQMLMGRATPAIPVKAKSLQFNKKLIDKMIQAINFFFKYTEHLIRPRLKWLNSRPGRSVMSIIVFIMGVLMCIPMPGTNTFPAMVIFLIGVGVSEDDGIFCIGAVVIGLFAVAIYAYALYYGMEIIDAVIGYAKEFVRGFF